MDILANLATVVSISIPASEILGPQRVKLTEMRPEVVINPPVEHRQWVGDKVDGEFGLAPASAAFLDSDPVTTRIKWSRA